ncbi:MAG: YbbR-like domain-containing protein [Pyrinomonadaceae bacterium]|nr:YbbR-like domain-containing protein [Sphingobacteriaceae bacterium]
MPIVSLNRIERRRVTVFLTCLLVAVFTWLFFALSNTYPYQVKSQINFINPPLNKAYDPLQDDTITLAVEGSGWQLLFSKLKLRPKILDVNLKALNTTNYVTISSQLHEINLQFTESNQKIVSASPDTLFFDFSKRITKRVPIKFLYKIGFKQSYGISNRIKLEPASVMVTGAAEDLKGINFWFTDTLSLRGISESVNTEIGFQKANKNNVDVYPKQVKVRIPVDEFTEKTIDVPLEITNNPGKDIKLIPEKVKITFLTALSNYDRMDRDSLKISVDLDNWYKNKFPQLPVKITRFPAFCKQVKTDPQTVDFLVKE